MIMLSATGDATAGTRVCAKAGGHIPGKGGGRAPDFSIG